MNGIAMLKFKFLLWVLTKLLRKAIRESSECAKHVRGKSITFQIRTAAGSGRYFIISDGKVNSFAGLAMNPEFTMNFKDAVTGFAILSAKDGKEAFLNALHRDDLKISGDFVGVLWFQRFAEFVN
ncbi:helicase [Burkholderia lata]|uniref:helicase n=1 Tax=Burkholderia lata (strain ATCC 17760 / DSM 23089 / LMG 22485 / NCIMB 9086 / R18194 / 383) TaxID=482957 RepID=UPI0014533C9D|nr:helicase [Burkholderia lata]VWB88073.1 helicase [Burkholderia lata]